MRFCTSFSLDKTALRSAHCNHTKENAASVQQYPTVLTRHKAYWSHEAHYFDKFYSICPFEMWIVRFFIGKNMKITSFSRWNLPPSAPVPKLFSMFAEKLRIDSADSLKKLTTTLPNKVYVDFFLALFFQYISLSSHKNIGIVRLAFCCCRLFFLRLCESFVFIYFANSYDLVAIAIILDSGLPDKCPFVRIAVETFVWTIHRESGVPKFQYSAALSMILAFHFLFLSIKSPTQWIMTRSFFCFSINSFKHRIVHIHTHFIRMIDRLC